MLHNIPKAFVTMLLKFLLSVLFCCTINATCLHAQVQIITTVAGSDDTGYCDHCPATRYAAGGGPMVLDKRGNIFLYYNNRIRKVDTAGIITTIAGTGVEGYTGDGGPATDATIRGIQGIAIDGFGNLYVLDYYLNIFNDTVDAVVRKIDTIGIITTIAGIPGGQPFGPYTGPTSGPATDESFYSPQGIVADKAGNVYVSDNIYNVVRKIDVVGMVSTFAGCGCGAGSTFADGLPATSVALPGTGRLAIDDTGNVYIAGVTGGCNIIKIDTAGILHQLTFRPWFPCMVIDSTGSIYYGGPALAANGNFWKTTPSGVTTCIAGCKLAGDPCVCDGSPATAANVFPPEAAAIDRAGNIYLSANSNRIRKISMGYVTDVKNVAEVGQGIEIYPNPAINTITISSPGTLMHIELRNIMGQLLRDSKDNTKNIELNIRDLPSGVYYVRVNDAQVERFIKE